MAKQDQLKRITELKKLLDEGLTRDEFIKSFETVVKQVLTIEQKIIEKSDKKTEQTIKDLEILKGQFKDIIEQSKKDSTSTFGQIKQRAMQVVEDFVLKSNLDKRITDTLKTVKDKMSEMDMKMMEVQDGHTPTPEEMKPVAMEAMHEMMPEMMKEHELTPEQTRDKLESIKEEKEKLAIKAIGYLEERLKKLEDRPMGGRGGGTSAIGVAQAFKYIAHTEEPTGLINGSNVTYTVKNTIWWIAGFTLNGEQIAELPNFTYSGHTITFASALPAVYSGKDFEIKYIGT